MNKIVVNQVEISKYASNIRQSANISTNVNGVSQALTSLGSNWKGQSYQNFATAYSNIESHITGFSSRMQQVANSINILATNTMNADMEK